MHFPPCGPHQNSSCAGMVHAAKRRSAFARMVLRTTSVTIFSSPLRQPLFVPQLLPQFTFPSRDRPRRTEPTIPACLPRMADIGSATSRRPSAAWRSTNNGERARQSLAPPSPLSPARECASTPLAAKSRNVSHTPSPSLVYPPPYPPPPSPPLPPPPH